MSVGVANWEYAPELMQSRVDSGRQGEPVEADEILMQRYQRGSEHAFRVLYERHRSPLLRFVKRLAPDGGDHEEIAQETWMAVIKGRERFLPEVRFVTYLYSIARRRTVDRWRRLGRLPEPDAEALDSLVGPTRHEPENHLSNAALGVDLLTAIHALPLPQREAFLLRAEAGLSIDEIAAVTGANRETAKSRLRFALSRLRNALEPWHDG
ncbi:MAG TPA: sigma-70 family RNA polymerase sigma factor [Steroidobacteraceae bacterium]|nr:sigma-70 family RNA polymerase sigma factor [Steroidobacteraceae bacterium]